MYEDTKNGWNYICEHGLILHLSRQKTRRSLRCAVWFNHCKPGWAEGALLVTRIAVKETKSSLTEASVCVDASRERHQGHQSSLFKVETVHRRSSSNFCLKIMLHICLPYADLKPSFNFPSIKSRHLRQAIIELSDKGHGASG